MEDLVEIRQDLLSLGKTEKLLDILIQTSRGVEHSLEYIRFTKSPKKNRLLTFFLGHINGT